MTLPATPPDAAPVAALPTPTNHHPELNRLRDDNPDYQRLQRATQVKLTASLRQLVTAIQRGESVPDAQRAFIQRHTQLLADAYRAAYAIGTRHYFDGVSRDPAKWAKRLAPTLSRDTLQQRLTFYAAGSVHKMASEAARAVHDAQPKHGDTQALREPTPLPRYIFEGVDAHNHYHGAKGRFEAGHAMEHAISNEHGGGHLHVELAGGPKARPGPE